MSEERKQAVLIVDDQVNWRTLLASILEDDYEVFCAGSFRHALSLVSGRSSPFAIALIDIRLDDRDPHNEDGLKLVRELRIRSIPTKTIFLTGYPLVRTTKTALQELQAADYLLKYPEDGTPFDFRNLRKVVAGAVKSFSEQYSDCTKPKTALIIEDEERWQQTLSEALGNYVTERVTNYNEAIKKIDAAQYRLVILDLKLGTRSPDQGMDLLSRIRTANPSAQVIIVSGYDSSKRVRDAFARYGVHDFLMKSHFDVQDFRESVRNVMECPPSGFSNSKLAP